VVSPLPAEKRTTRSSPDFANDVKCRGGQRMHNQLTFVHAAHDIRRGDRTIVKCGTPGRVLDVHPSWFETTYTVKFDGIGKNHRGAITLIGLNKDDVQPGRSNTRAD
jgi:hypothetical protein